MIREKALPSLGASPVNPHQGLCPWTPLGAYGGLQTPACFFLVHVIPLHQKFLDPRLVVSISNENFANFFSSFNSS
jgi:hypothetical protein